MINLKKVLFIMMVFFSNFALANYTIYEGTIGKNKVELYFDAFYDNDINIIYLNNDSFEPKQLDNIHNAQIEDGLVFNVPKTNFGEDIIDTIVIKNIDFNKDRSIILNQNLEGYSKKYGDFKLVRKFDYEFTYNDDDNLKLKNNIEFENEEIIQRESTKDYYFKTLVSKKKGEFLKVVGINVYRKKDGSLFQTINDLKDFGFLSFTSIYTNRDANFDGKDNDFYISKSKESINDSNVIDAYFSYDEKQNKFVYLNLTGRFITFDSDKKTAKKEKICPIKTAMTRATITDLYEYSDDKKYTLTNSKCELIKYSDNGEKILLSRACNKKEKLFCQKASELMIDEYAD